MADRAIRRTEGWLAGLWFAALVTLSFLPGQWKQALHTKGRLHDGAHLVTFAVLAWLMARAARTRDKKIVALCLAALIGFAVEILQYLVYLVPSGMHSPVEWKDILLDVMAVLIVAVVQLGIRPETRETDLRPQDS